MLPIQWFHKVAQHNNVNEIFSYCYQVFHVKIYKTIATYFLCTYIFCFIILVRQCDSVVKSPRHGFNLLKIIKLVSAVKLVLYSVSYEIQLKEFSKNRSRYSLRFNAADRICPLSRRGSWVHMQKELISDFWNVL